MKDGTYQFVVTANSGAVEALATLAGGAIDGASLGYEFGGRLTAIGDRVEGVITAVWTGSLPPSLGMFKSISVHVNGPYDPVTGGFTLEGQVSGHHVVSIKVVATPVHS
ncbi:MAG: GrlR family regulatory protein [Acidimicrobiia bacterium]